MGHSLITYKGKEISYIDYRGLTEEEMIKTVDDTVEWALKDNKPRLVLFNITKAYALSGFMKKSKEAGKKTKHLVIKSAIVGVTEGKKILLKFYNAFS